MLVYENQLQGRQVEGKCSVGSVQREQIDMKIYFQGEEGSHLLSSKVPCGLLSTLNSEVKASGVKTVWSPIK